MVLEPRKGLEKGGRTITSHPRLPRHAGRDQHDLRASQRLPQAGRRGLVAGHFAAGVDVPDIGRDACNANRLARCALQLWILGRPIHPSLFSP